MFKNVEIVFILMNYNNRTLNVIGLFVAIVAIVVPTIFFIISASDEIKIQSIIIFGIISIIVIILSFSYLIYRGYRRMFNDFKENKRDINEIKKSLNYHNLFNEMDVRLRVIEKLFEMKNKKGQFIDPRIIWIIVLLILLYLFLKSIGVFP